jgi:putative sigma-54 modulation protein
MNMDVTYRNIRPSTRLKGRAEKKFLKVAKHLREPIDAHFVLREEKHMKIAEFTVTGSGGVFKAEEHTDDMFASIDGAMNKLERVVRRHKERAQDRWQSGSGEASDGFVIPSGDDGMDIEA